MSDSRMSPGTSRPSRRDFLKTGAAAGAVLGGLTLAQSAHAAGSDVLKVGLIGCGGRGRGAAAQALNADPNAKLVALADAFPEPLQLALGEFKKSFGDRVDVKPENCFVGLDAYKKLIASGVDVVLLCEPPHFRPISLKEAIAAGKHVFCEKPVAVDAPGVRSVLASCRAGQEEGAERRLGPVLAL